MLQSVSKGKFLVERNSNAKTTNGPETPSICDQVCWLSSLFFVVLHASHSLFDTGMSISSSAVYTALPELVERPLDGYTQDTATQNYEKIQH